MTFTKIALAGPSGFLGRKVLTHLLTIPSLSKITILTQSVTPQNFPTSPLLTLIPISSYEDKAALTSALKDHDLLISTVAGAAAGTVDRLLLAAATEADVRRFMPSEFTVDVLHPNALTFAGTSLVAAKIANAKYIQELAQQGKIEYTTLVTGGFLDWWFEMPNPVVNVMGREVKIFDGGDKRLTGVSTEFVARCIEAVILMPEEETRDQRIRVAEVEYSGNDMLRAFEEVTGEEWTAVHQTTDALLYEAEKASGRGDKRGQYLATILKLNFDGRGAASFEEGKSFAPKVERGSLVDIVRRSLSAKV
ncbi:hypothetical protein BKA65DRAFT_562405 [Rhexocercosporidium sp. MPI-PUGE-AT-0058]|nr:hypothetical protein BKA65DRAFT_562405 [Rhexocercosporidium sp. MPI-PUGE-AT-0058]